MVTRPTNKSDVVDGLHSFIMQHNREIGIASGMPADQVDEILQQNIPANKLLCEHIYDWLKVEGYIE